MYKRTMISLAFLALVMIGIYLSFSFAHTLFDNKTLNFGRYEQWLPGGYAPIGECFPIHNDMDFFSCQMGYEGGESVYFKVDSYSGKIQETLLSFPVGTISQFLYRYGEPNSIRLRDGKWGEINWNHVRVYFYKEYHPDTVVSSVLFY